MGKKYVLRILLALLIMLSMGTVNAADLNQSDDNLTSKSFHEFNETIYGDMDGDVVECRLDSDYEFVKKAMMILFRVL